VVAVVALNKLVEQPERLEVVAVEQVASRQAQVGLLRVALELLILVAVAVEVVRQ
jgi:hypothetical protein